PVAFAINGGVWVTNQSGRLELSRVSIGLFPLQIPPRCCSLRSGTPSSVCVAVFGAEVTSPWCVGPGAGAVRSGHQPDVVAMGELDVARAKTLPHRSSCEPDEKVLPPPSTIRGDQPAPESVPRPDAPEIGNASSFQFEAGVRQRAFL